MELTAAIGWVCLVLGAASVACGIWMTIIHRNQEVPVAKPGTVGDHGTVNDAIKNAAEFATALKDLDLGGKLLTVGILLIAIAAITAGLDDVTEAIKSIQ
jgi:hypothetical protein